MKFITKTTKLFDAQPAPDDIVPGYCFVESKRSRSVEVENGRNSKIKNISFAYLSLGEPFWGAPIEIAAQVGAKQRVSFDLRTHKLLITSCKIKFTSTAGTFTDSIDADPGLFIGCVGLKTEPTGEFSTWWTQMVLPSK